MATLAGFKGGFAGLHYRAPTEQEIWDAAYQAGIAAQLAAPAGYKLVPIEPTQAMMDAAEKTVPHVFSMGDEYRAMVAAAPQGEEGK